MDFDTLAFPNNKYTYIAPTWDDLSLLAFDVAKQIREQDLKIERIVTLAKGGWPMTRSLVDYLEVPDVASIGIRFYQGVYVHLDKPDVYQNIPVSVRGERVLLFDDVVDSGASFEYTKQFLLDEGVKSVTTASLFYKPHSSYRPDFYGAETSSWIIFPYDAAEMIRVLGGQWRLQNISTNEIRERFSKLGFKSEIVEYYFQGGQA